MKNIENYRTMNVSHDSDSFYHLMIYGDRSGEEIILVRSPDYVLSNMLVKKTGSVYLTVFHPGTQVPLSIAPCNVYEPLDDIGQAETG